MVLSVCEDPVGRAYSPDTHKERPYVSEKLLDLGLGRRVVPIEDGPSLREAPSVGHPGGKPVEKGKLLL